MIKIISQNKFLSLFLSTTAKMYIVLGLVINIFWLLFSSGYGDFGSFYSSAQAFRLGNNPFAASYAYVSRPFLDGVSIASPNLNPPISLYLFSPLTLFPIQTSFFLWNLLQISLFSVSIVQLFRNFQVVDKRKKIIWAIAFGGLWQTIQVGQIYSPLLFLLVCAYILLDKEKDIFAGLLLGALCAIKPSFLILVFFLAILNRKKVFLSAIASFLIIWSIPLALLGLGIYREWISVSSTYAGINFPLNSTFIGLFSRLGYRSIGYLISGLLIVASACLILIKRPKLHEVMYLGLLCSLLGSPITWAGYLMFLIPPLFIDVNWKSSLLIPLLLFCTPVTTVYGFTNPNHTIEILWGWMFGFGLLWLYIHEVIRILGIPHRTTNSAESVS